MGAVLPVASSAATLQIIFTGTAGISHGGEAFGLDTVDGDWTTESYRATYTFDPRTQTEIRDGTLASSLVAASLTVNDTTVHFDHGTAHYLYFPASQSNIWSQFAAETTGTDLSGSMGHWGFFMIEEIVDQASFGMDYTFFTDDPAQFIYGGESYFDIAEHDAGTGDVISETYGLLFAQTIEVRVAPSPVPLPAGFPIFLTALGGLFWVSRRRSARG